MFRATLIGYRHANLFLSCILVGAIIAPTTTVHAAYPPLIQEDFDYIFEQEHFRDDGRVLQVGCAAGSTGGGAIASEASGNIPETHRSILVEAAGSSVSPNLLAALFLTEHGNVWRPLDSAWDSSDAGASGPFQFMPGTWTQHQQDGDGDGTNDIMNFADAAFAAADMAKSQQVTLNTPLGDLSDPFKPGTIIYFAMAYNWGSGNVQSRIDRADGEPLTMQSMPQETQRYVENIHALISSDFTTGGKGDYGEFLEYSDPVVPDGAGAQVEISVQPQGSCASHLIGALPSTPPTVTCEDKKVVDVTPASNLNSLVNAAGNETACFRLANGNYAFGNIRPLSGQTFLGESPGGVIVNGNGFENAFHGTANNVSISNFTLTNYNNSGGTNLQQQAPIRGNSALWSSDRADGWVVENMVLSNNIAGGVFMGHNFTVRNNIIANNGVTGVGGSKIIGGLVTGNDISGNGFDEATGDAVNGGGIKITSSIGTATQLHIHDNEVHDNKRGIWCDVDCNGVLIENNRSINNGNTGIFYEVSRNAVIRDNRVENSSGYATWLGRYNAGSISAGESENVVIDNNTIVGGRSAITIRGTIRNEKFLTDRIDRGEYLNLTARNITVQNNTIIGSQSIGASHEPGAAGFMDYGSIRFINNTYSNPESMDFWWNRIDMDYATWQDQGRN